MVKIKRHGKKKHKKTRKQTIKVLLFYNTAEAAAVAATLKVLCLRAVEDKKGPDWMLLPSLCIMSLRFFNTPLTYHSPALSLYYLCLVSYYCGYVPVSCCHHSSPKFARPLRTVIIPDTFPGVASARFVPGIFSQLVCVCVRAHTHTRTAHTPKQCYDYHV